MIGILRALFKCSGTNERYLVTSDNERVLADAARRLGVEIKTDGRGKHLDLKQHKLDLAKRYGYTVVNEASQE